MCSSEALTERIGNYPAAPFFEAMDDALDTMRNGTPVFSRERRASYTSDLRARGEGR